MYGIVFTYLKSIKKINAVDGFSLWTVQLFEQTVSAIKANGEATKY